MSKKGSKLAPYTIRYNEISDLNLDSLDVRIWAVHGCMMSNQPERREKRMVISLLTLSSCPVDGKQLTVQKHCISILYHLDGHLDVVTEDVTCPDDHDDCSVSMLLSQPGAPHITSALLRVPPPTERRHSGHYSCRAGDCLHQHSTNHSLWQEYQINILL